VFFDRFDAILFLAAPGFEAVLDWRCEQEAALMGVTVLRRAAGGDRRVRPALRADHALDARRRRRRHGDGAAWTASGVRLTVRRALPGPVRGRSMRSRHREAAMPQIRANGIDVEYESHAIGRRAILLIMGLGAQIDRWPPELIDN